MTKAKQAIVNKHAANTGMTNREAEHKFVQVTIYKYIIYTYIHTYKI